MNDQAVMAQFGLKPSDYETSSMENIARAAKDFERALNSAKGCVHVEMNVISAQEIGGPDRRFYSFRITTVESVYP